MLFKRSALIAALAAVLLLSCGLCSADNSGDDSEIYENKVTFIAAGSAILSLDFKWDGGYFVTYEQPWNGVSSSFNNQKLTITAQAGRVLSDTVATSFNNLTYAKLGINAGDAAPKALNFAFSGTLYINGDFYEVMLGQGSNTKGNNWWIGSKFGFANSLSSYNGKKAMVSNRLFNNYCITQGNNNHTFIVSAI